MPRKNRSDEMRERILQAYLSCLSSKSLAECTVREIAQKANVPTGSILYYFESKENLIAACIKKIYQGYIQIAHEWAIQLSPDICSFLEFFTEYKRLMEQYAAYERTLTDKIDYPFFYHIYAQYPKAMECDQNNLDSFIQELTLAISRTKLKCENPSAIALALIGMQEGFSMICTRARTENKDLDLFAALLDLMKK